MALVNQGFLWLITALVEALLISVPSLSQSVPLLYVNIRLTTRKESHNHIHNSFINFGVCACGVPILVTVYMTAGIQIGYIFNQCRLMLACLVSISLILIIDILKIL